MLENKRAETLRLLRESGENVSGQDLCEHFGISRTAVWKIMNQLKEEGYEIEAVQNKGYRLLNEPDAQEAMLELLKTWEASEHGMDK